MKFRLLVIFVTFLFLAGCVSAPAKNSRSKKQQHARAQAAFDELDGKPQTSKSNPPASYSQPAEPRTNTYTEPKAQINLASDRYLSAKGYGASRPEAIRQAKAELSNIFESRISSDVKSKVSQITDSIKGSSSYKKSIQSKVRVESEIELEGVITGPVKKELLEYVAVAAIDKYNAKEKWGNDINKINSKIDVLLDKSNSAQSKILKLLPLKKVLDLWVEKEVILSRLRVIGFSSEFPQKGLRPILVKISNLKKSMLINIDISGAHGQAVRDNVAEILNNSGLKISESKSNSDVLITGSVKITKVKNNNPRFKFSRALVSLNIIDASTNNQVGQVSANGRAAGLNYEASAHKAVKKVTKDVWGKLVKYFN